MAVSAKWYGQALLKALNKEIDWDSDAIKIMLCTSAYTPDQDTHIYKSSVTGEVAGAGYTAGGATLASKTIVYTAGTNLITLDAADVSWPSATITARYAVIYDSSPGTDATDPLLAFIDFGQDIISTNGTFTIAFNASGILTITAA